jgi:hypothetical protein
MLNNQGKKHFGFPNFPKFPSEKNPCAEGFTVNTAAVHGDVGEPNRVGSPLLNFGFL